ncbi:hypothetical protein TNCV_1340511 [Trichonephila clavipes]|nr:hypothetical protein TNCV_1340511 [Trichonephila clavipes]
MFRGNNGRVLFYCDSPDLSDTLTRETFRSISESEVPNKSGSEITPRQEFRLLCGNTVTGLGPVGRACPPVATSSGLRKATPQCGPHPGTTWNWDRPGLCTQLIEQPGHVLVRLSRAPVLSGGLARRKPQLFSMYPLHGRLLQDPTSLVKGLWSGREKEEKGEIGLARKRAENEEGSLGFPGFVKPVFTKDSKPLGRRKRSLGHLGSVKPVLT